MFFFFGIARLPVNAAEKDKSHLIALFVGKSALGSLT